MKPKYLQITVIIFLFFVQNIFSQSQYELLYLQKDYQQIADLSTGLEDSTMVYWHAVALDKMGRTIQAIQILETGLEKYKQNEVLELLYADYLFKTGQNSKAKPFLLKHQKNPDVFMKLIRTFELESDNISAITFLEERLETDSMNIEYLARLGDNYNEVERELSARKVFQKVIEINPKDVVVLAKLANLQLKINEKNRYDIAIHYCDQALNIDPSNRTIIQIKGIAAFRKGDFEMAQESFSYLLEKGDTNITTLKHLGISEYKNDYQTESYEHLLMAYKQDTSDYEICYFMARDLIYNRAPEEGLYYLKLADTLIHPKPAIQVAIIVEMAAAYTDMNKNEKAIDLYTLAYSILPRSDYLFFIASLYQNRIKDNKKALEYYQRFMAELPPTNEEFSESPKKPQSISLKRTAEMNIEKLKEELFFNGELVNDTIKD